MIKKQKKYFVLLLAALLILNVFPISVAASSGTAFYVAADGDDSGNGSISSPFKTLEKARDTIRAMKKKPDGGITVYVRGGTYKIDKTFELTDDDSGTDNCPINY